MRASSAPCAMGQTSNLYSQSTEQSGHGTPQSLLTAALPPRPAPHLLLATAPPEQYHGIHASTHPRILPFTPPTTSSHLPRTPPYDSSPRLPRRRTCSQNDIPV
jgi:hypothetical protein